MGLSAEVKCGSGVSCESESRSLLPVMDGVLFHRFGLVGRL